MWRTQKFDVSIVVLGSGFAGIECAKRVARAVRGRKSVHVALVDRENYFVFQPLLPEVASASIQTAHVVNPVRQLVPEVDFDCSEVDRIDVDARLVHFKALEGIEMMPMPYTHLVLALGTTPNLGVVPGMAAHGLPMKTVGDAYHLRNHLVTRLELAANTRDTALRRELLTIVVVGGGFSGVETCAEVHDMMLAARRWYPELEGDPIRSVLVASTERILPALSETLSAYALGKLRKRGVEVLLGSRVTSVTPRSCFLADGSEIATRTVVSTIGESPHELLKRLPFPQEKGRLVVDACLRVPGWDDVWAIGDCARVTNAHDGKPCPATAQFAIPQGRQCAENLVAALDGRPQKPFSHRAQGYLASLGHRSAVAELGPVRLSGFVAWWIWRTIYLFKLPGLSRKIRVALDWTLDLFFSRDILQLQTGRTERVGRHHYEPGQVIVEQGHVGDTFFSIVAGECEVLRRDEDGRAQTVATLGPGAYFGEEALLTGQPRSATVRALTRVDVVCIGRTDFLSLSEHVSFVREAFAKAPADDGKAPADHPTETGTRTSSRL